jgi:hypothetical protein
MILMQESGGSLPPRSRSTNSRKNRYITRATGQDPISQVVFVSQKLEGREREDQEEATHKKVLVATRPNIAWFIKVTTIINQSAVHLQDATALENYWKYCGNTHSAACAVTNTLEITGLIIHSVRTLPKDKDLLARPARSSTTDSVPNTNMPQETPPHAAPPHVVLLHVEIPRVRRTPEPASPETLPEKNPIAW